jgi:hypothetical protein
MSRQKIFQKWNIPPCIVKIVFEFCADYKRRAAYIERNSSTVGDVHIDDTVSEYRRINNAIDRALLNVECGIRKELLRDIERKVGYYKSGLQVIMCKDAYYNRRNKLIYDIAEGICLI